MPSAIVLTMNPSIDEIKAAYANKGYTFFSELKPYNVNIWGIRKLTDRVDVFNDVLGLSCKDDQGNIIHMVHTATVDPGLFYLKNQLLNPKGTFILRPGQYMGCWEKAMHKKHLALKQKQGYTGFRGWRDNKLDGVIQRKLDVNGNFYLDVEGLDMHRSSETFSSVVGQHSAGCQVRQVKDEHLKVLAVIDKSIALYGNSFSYTLFDEDEVFPGAVLTRSRSADGQPTKVWPNDFMIVEQKN
jgi:hypothetical protein